MNGVLAKIGGWAMFALQLLGQFTTPAGTPHGWAQWLVTIGSLAAAVGIHAASNVGQVAQGTSATTTLQAQHLNQ